MSKRPASLCVLACTTALLTLVGRTAVASDDMPPGAPTAPPIGFVELCARAPAACVQTRDPSARQLDAVRLWAGQARWAVLFGERLGVRAPSTATAALEASQHKPTAKPSPKGRTKAGSIKLAVEPAPASETTPPTGSPPRVFSDLSLDQLNAINRNLNRTIRPADDPAGPGSVDRWSLPSDRDLGGDCEDYVLAKRQALIEAGVPIQALSIAVVETPRRDLHAVLLVATAEGEVVLDNLSPWIVSWRQMPYRWLQRQQAGSALSWVQPGVQSASSPSA